MVLPYQKIAAQVFFPVKFNIFFALQIVRLARLSEVREEKQRNRHQESYWDSRCYKHGSRIYILKYVCEDSNIYRKRVQRIVLRVVKR